MASRRPCEDAEKERGQPKCANRLCTDGEGLVPALEMACRYYGVNCKDKHVVCQTCLRKSLVHYIRGETLRKKEKCAMECNFPNVEKPIVIDSSSEDELESQSNFDSSSSTESETSNCHDKANFCFPENRDIVTNKRYLCDEYFNYQVQYANKVVKKIDKRLSNIENELVEWKNSLQKPCTSIINNGSLDLVDNEVEKQNKVHKIINKTNERIYTKDLKKDITNKDGIIAVNYTRYNVPTDLPRKGQMVYPSLRAGNLVYGMLYSYSTEKWVIGIINGMDNGFILVTYDNKQMVMNPGDVAYYDQSSVRYLVGSRVISKYSDPNVTSSTKREHFYAGIVAEPPTVQNDFNYLIFYDDGRVQYRCHKDIRLILLKSREVWKCVKNGNDIYKSFLQIYLKMYPDRYMVRFANKHDIKVKYQGKWTEAKVIKVYASLVELYFVETKKKEWLYRGSPRLIDTNDKLKDRRLCQPGVNRIYNSFLKFYAAEEEPKEENPKDKNLKNDELRGSYPTAITNVAVNSTTTCLKPTSTEHILLKSQDNNKVNYKIIKLTLPNNAIKPQKFVPHECNPTCVDWTEYNYNNTKNINILAIPTYFGFVRRIFLWENEDSGTDEKKAISPINILKSVMYICPCGRTIRSMEEMLYYLMVVKSKMTIELFDLSNWVNPMVEFKIVSFIKYVSDISWGKEFKEISCVNSITPKGPPNMTYITSRQPMPGVNINTDHNFLCGCDCTDNCQDKSKCACWQLTIKNQNIISLDDNEYDPDIGYHYRRLPERVITGIYECNSTCKCSDTCLNRVVQQPLSQKLQLFMTEKKGWGVRCLNDIPSGSFICVYVGYLLTENDANHGGLNYGDEYLAELDYIEVVEKTKEDYEEIVQLGDKEKIIGDKVCKSETFNEDYEVPYEKANRVGSDMKSRLRKRKIEEPTKKKFKAKKVSRHALYRKSVRNYFGKNEKVYIMDAKTNGNIGRYINHSCKPNLFVQNVFVDTHDVRFPWISFFALHYIPAGTELAWDYNYNIGSVPGKSMLCYCESEQCRKRLL